MLLNDDDVQALGGFAAQAASGLDRAQAQEDPAALAIRADRDRIARDLTVVRAIASSCRGFTLG